MNPHRTLILLFATISWVFLTGLQKPGHHQTARHKAPAVQTTQTPPPLAEPPKPPLDLSVPFKNPANDATNGTAPPSEPKATQMDGLFEPPPKKTNRPIELKGGLLNSPDPEVEKRKSVDGASIMIDIKQ